VSILLISLFTWLHAQATIIMIGYIMETKTFPAFIQRYILVQLFEATAGAFGCPVPEPGPLSCEEYLHSYALFTRQQAEKAIQSGQDITSLETRLYQNAYALGERLRKWFGLASQPAGDLMRDVMQLGQVLYRAIGVEMVGDAHGSVTVYSCYFSQFYSAAVCDLISALDAGIFSGLTGGSRLAFSERLTQGSGCCKAKLMLGSK
jgi:hypothetical protein